MDQEKELSPQQERELTRKLRSASSIAEIKEIGSQLGMDFTEELAKKYLETIMRNSKGSPRAKIVGMVPATDEERIHLMKTLLHFTEEKARGLLKKMDSHRPAYIERPTWEDFFAATERKEKENIIQGIFDWTLSQEEIEMFFSED